MYISTHLCYCAGKLYEKASSSPDISRAPDWYYNTLIMVFNCSALASYTYIWVSLLSTRQIHEHTMYQQVHYLPTQKRPHHRQGRMLLQICKNRLPSKNWWAFTSTYTWTQNVLYTTSSGLKKLTKKLWEVCQQSYVFRQDKCNQSGCH